MSEWLIDCVTDRSPSLRCKESSVLCDALSCVWYRNFSLHNLLSRWATLSFSERTLLHGDIQRIKLRVNKNWIFRATWYYSDSGKYIYHCIKRLGGTVVHVLSVMSGSRKKSDYVLKHYATDLRDRLVASLWCQNCFLCFCTPLRLCA